MLDGSHYYECRCDSEEHTIKFVYNKDDNEFYVSLYLDQYHNIFKRIWIAIRYLFKYKCRYGDWECWTMKEEDANRLIEMLKELKPDPK